MYHDRSHSADLVAGENLSLGYFVSNRNMVAPYFFLSAENTGLYWRLLRRNILIMRIEFLFWNSNALFILNEI